MVIYIKESDIKERIVEDGGLLDTELTGSHLPQSPIKEQDQSGVKE